MLLLDGAARNFSKVRKRLNNKPTFILAALSFAGLLFFSVLLFFTTRISGTDDTVFSIQAHSYGSVFEWVMYRYDHWSGRLFAEAFIYIFSQADIWLWKIIMLLMYAAFAFVMYLYFKLASPYASPVEKYSMLTLASLLPFFMDQGALFYGMLWMTGAMNYFWIVVFGLIAFYPLAYYISRKQAPHPAVTLIGILCAIIAASSQEQVGAVLLALSILLTIASISDRKIKNKSLPYPFLFLVIIGMAFYISAAAPGNGIRIVSETAWWLPNFHTVPLIERVGHSIRWIFDSIINHMGLLLIGLWIMLVSLFVKKARKTKFDILIISILCAASVLLIAKGFSGITYLYEFYAQWGITAPDKVYGVMFIWTIVLIATIIAPLRLYRDRRGWLMALLICAAVASTSIITLSPTVYASGARTLFVPSVLLLAAAYLLFSDVIGIYKKNRFILVLSLACLGVSSGVFTILYFFLHK